MTHKVNFGGRFASGPRTCILSGFPARAARGSHSQAARRLPQRTIMIEEPPPIVFAPSIERPSADVVERFRAPTSFIVDAMNGTGALDWRIKRLVGGSFVGVALTCDCEIG